MSKDKQPAKKQKMGYKQYEQLLSLAHQKSEILAQRVQALQSYLIAYIDYNKDNDKFNDYVNQRIVEEQKESKNKEEQVNEKV